MKAASAVIAAEKEATNPKMSLHTLQVAANGGKENLVGGRRKGSGELEDDVPQKPAVIMDAEKLVAKAVPVYEDNSNEKPLPEKVSGSKKSSTAPLVTECTKQNVSEDLGSSVASKCTNSKEISLDDLTSTVCSEKYWEIIAEKRRVALHKLIQENTEMREKMTALQEENTLLKEMVAGTADIIKIVNEAVEAKKEEEDKTAGQAKDKKSGQEENTKPGKEENKKPRKNN